MGDPVKALLSLRIPRWPAMALVLGILAAISVGPGIGTASAGFDCKEIPVPEAPELDIVAQFDTDSAYRTDPNDHTGYGTYGWAGLSWYTYDLGCGNDLTRSPRAVADTALANEFFKTGQMMAGVSFWLDRQTSTPADAEAQGRTSFLVEFDKLIVAITTEIKSSVYGKFMAIALCVVGVVILWRGLRADAASVTKSALLGGVALGLGALLVGAPQQAIRISDDTFAALITDQQREIFAATGTTGRPRDVVLDQILIPDYTRGWFGDPAAADAAELEPQIRNAIALTYEESARIEEDPGAADAILDEKKKQFQDVVDKLEENGLSYHVFQGKDSGRVSIGLMSMLKMATISILWSGASLLKLAALLAIRLAILTAPLWIPVAAVSGGVMERVLRALMGAYLWGVAASVLISVYLLTLVKLYELPAGAASPAWKFWLMLLLTIFTWAIMRPFKRISNLTRQNNTSVFNRSGMRRKARMLGDLATGRVPRRGNGKEKDHGGNDRPTYGKPAPSRPEGATTRDAEHTPKNNAKAFAAKARYHQKMAQYYGDGEETDPGTAAKALYHQKLGQHYSDKVGTDPNGTSGGTSDPGKRSRGGAASAPGSAGSATDSHNVYISNKGGLADQAGATGRIGEPAGSSSARWNGQLWVASQSSNDRTSRSSSATRTRGASAITGPSEPLTRNTPTTTGDS